MSILTRIGRFFGFMARSLVWSIHIGVFFYTLLIYYLLARLPLEHWSASMLMISLPVAWLVLIVLGVMWLFSRPWRSLLSVVALLAGFWLWPRTFSYDHPDPVAADQTAFSLLSYNVSVFGLEDLYKDKLKREPRKTRLITDWVIRHPAPIKCFQEFYTGDETPAFDMVNRLTAAGYPYKALLQPTSAKYLGVATFSRYPIVRQGHQPFNSFNGLVWADIAIGTDTIRVINVHLQSMGIRVRRVFEEDQMAGVKAETRTVLGALKTGFVSRRGEVQVIEDLLATTPYPAIVTGDFNDTPYSVVYQRMRNKLHNAFEDAGRGFGLSLNRAPRFIRIDNQFYTPDRLRPTNFLTHNEVPYSDHFAVEASYALSK
ncbi:endonuclease/exonuclease/phosphatase family protein [Fibrella sp. HMF5335]|uniref:Endonuclease/exonuclease/phosphatase family protein n=1 Tax=Fibrella rubiginis TaxID=2817060 RepID=A0A939GHG9_9BACT|nr:endonuclease/exonuclease/phosphatase family protein [Fibrella rubiginis]MBO0936557.1 endonuclease/exonuclease/phosphatase family protein [Fibrella rubiginis]